MSFFNNIGGAGLLPAETISVAMTTAPKAIPVLSGIIKLSTDIRETTERVAANKDQCQQLSERIDTLIGFLAERDFSVSLNEAMHTALNRFESFLKRCLEFISTFLEASWMKRIMNNKDYEKKFLDFHRELTQYSNDLNFGIGLNSLSGKTKNTGGNRDGPKRHDQDNDDQVPNATNDDYSESQPDDSESSSMINPGMERQRPQTIFMSGLWQYRYQQCNQIFGPFPQEITFNTTENTLRGYGEDNVGQYTLKGSFIEAKGKIEMFQHYQLGTGNPEFNIGHRDLMKLKWNPQTRVFEGISYSQMNGGFIPGASIQMWFSGNNAPFA